MSKKHFIALADALRQSRPKDSDNAERYYQWQIDLNAICEWCKAENPRFMEDRFRGYILGLNGPNGGAVKS